MIRFYNPGYVWYGLLILVLLGVIFYYWRARRRLLKQFAEENLMWRLLDDYRPTLRRTKLGLFFSSLVLLFIALLGPQIGEKLVEVKRKGQDIILILDTSLSMLAEDVKPNRLERAKYECSRFIDNLQGDRVGIVVFAGTAFLQCPLTLDYSAAKLFLDAVDCGVVGTQGTALNEAIGIALDAFKSEDKTHKIMIVVSDGEDHEGGIEEIVREVQKRDAIIYSVGIGTYAGAPIPIKKQGVVVDFKRDRAGRVVTTSLYEPILRNLATATGGKYYNLMAENNALMKVYQDILGLEKRTLASHEYSEYQLHYQIFGFLGLITMLTSIFIPEKLPRKLRGEAE